MLKGIWIENFKSYRTGQLLPLAPLTLMIGANASGKSNAIEAFRFLSWYVGGEKLSTIQNRINDSEKIFRGDIRDLFCLNDNNFILGANFNNEWEKYRIDIEIDRKENNLVISDESLTTSNTHKFLFKLDEIYEEEVNEPLPSLSLTYKDALHNDSNLAFSIDKDSSLLSEIKDFSSINSIFSRIIKNLNEIHEVVSAILNSLKNTYFFDFVPSQMRQDSLAEFKLRPNGQNLSGVLYALWQYEPHQEDILKFIKSLPEQDFKTLKFYPDHRDRIELALVENFANQEQEWNSDVLSDGTLRVLGIAAAILSVPENSTLVIEEIDNGIHPSRAKSLLNTMLLFAEKRNLKLLLTTHNPALMDALPDQALGDVVFAYRDPEQGDSRLIRLSDLEDYEGLVSQGSLGELVTKEVVDRFVKNPVSNEAKKQKALNWLEQMRGISHE